MAEKEPKKNIDLKRVDLGKFSGYLPGGYLREALEIPTLDDKTRGELTKICQDIDRLIAEQGLDLASAKRLERIHLDEQDMMVNAAIQQDRPTVEYHYERSHAYNLVYQDLIRPIFEGMLALGYNARDLI